MNDAITVAVISAVGGIIAAGLAYKARQGTTRRLREKPRDRMETIFDGYEAFIARQDKALSDKDKQLVENQIIINRMQKQIDQMNELIERQRIETDREREINKRLHQELDNMRSQYSTDKNEVK